MKLETTKLANHHNFYNATLYIKCEEKNESVSWYGYDDSNLKKSTTKTTRGCGRISRYTGNTWKRISKKAAAEILAKYGITVEQFIAYTNEEPEIMNELNEQRAEEERQELLDFFMSKPFTSNEALEVATDAETELAKMANNNEEENKMENAVAIITTETEENAYEGRELINEVNLLDGAGIADEQDIAADEVATEEINSDIEEIKADNNKAQCTWEDAHKYENVGDLTDRALVASNSRLAAFVSKSKAQKARERWAKSLENAKLDENGKMSICLLYEGDGPMAYVINSKGKKVRIASKLAYQLIQEGRAVKITTTKAA